MTLEVIGAGVLSTVQDAGRPGFAHLGVPVSGACDPLGLAVANVLLDNDADAPVIEVTLGGLEVDVRETTVIGIGGADLGAIVVGEGRPLGAGASHLVWAGSRVAFRGRSSDADSGARAYLAVPGGVEVPEVLGSASTCLVGRFGGLDGRPLRSGDVLRARSRANLGLAGRTWPGDGLPARDGATTLRVVPGPHPRRFARGAMARLATATWTVRTDSDRMGIRLAGTTSVGRHVARELVSTPMVWGAVQVPSDEAPIVLLADHQSVGGYPVVAVVIRADRPGLGQVAPGDLVRFEPVDLLGAEAAWKADRARFATHRQRLDREDRHGRAWQDAGG